MSLPLDIQKQISTKLSYFEKPKRQALSKKFPILVSPLLFLRRIARKIENFLRRKKANTQSQFFFPCVLARHQSLLRRTLGDADPRLQEQKITNIVKAIQHLNGLILYPNETFSLWERVGNPTKNRGYVGGMLLSGGKVIEGVGGGLCQLSNFLCWIFLHTNVQIIERHHHSFDSFPDSGRTIPFGSGATIFYNLLDLKIKNISSQPLQIKIFCTDKHLKGQIVSPQPSAEKFRVIQKFHCFIEHKKNFFRYNQIWQEKFLAGKKIEEKHIFTNFAPILYSVDAQKIQEEGSDVILF